MIERFLKFYEACFLRKQSLQLEITHDKCADWYIYLVHKDSETVIYEDNGYSLNLLCASAYIALDEWAREFPDLEDIEVNLK